MAPASSADAHPISVVVVTYCGARWIRTCLASLFAGTEVPHVIVVDNASSDDTCAIVEAEFPQVQLIRHATNAGFGIGNNLGMRAALDRGARTVFLLNQDAYVLPDTVAAMRAFLDRHPEFGVASPLHCSPDADHLDGRTLRGYLQTHLPQYLADACMGRVQDHYRTFGVNAAAWFVRAEVLTKAGGFDPMFFMYGEDDDLLVRWQHHGIAFALVPGTRVVHLRQSATGARPSLLADIRRKADRRRSELLTSIKRPGFSLPHMLAVWFAEGWVTPLADALVRREPREYLASVVAAVRIAFAFSRLRRHARLTGGCGRHFL
jgi:GT2 family glycosyltransferase